MHTVMLTLMKNTSCLLADVWSWQLPFLLSLVRTGLTMLFLIKNISTKFTFFLGEKWCGNWVKKCINFYFIPFWLYFFQVYENGSRYLRNALEKENKNRAQYVCFMFNVHLFIFLFKSMVLNNKLHHLYKWNYLNFEISSAYLLYGMN